MNTGMVGCAGLLAVLSLACSGSDPEPPASIPGTWRGDYEGEETGGTLRLDLDAGASSSEYSGTAQLTGVLSSSGMECFTEGIVTAELSGSNFSFTVSSESMTGGLLFVNTLRGQGTIEGTSFDGSFTLRGDSCPDDDGSVNLEKN